VRGSTYCYGAPRRLLRTVLLLLTSAWIVAAIGSPAEGAFEVHGPRLHDNGGIGYGPLNGPQFGVFAEPQFNDLGGTRTLLRVTLDVTVDSTGGSAEFDNQFTSGGTVTLAIGSFVDVLGPDPTPGARLIANANAVNTLTGPVTATTGEIPANFAGPDYISLLGSSSSDTDSDSYATAPELAPYIGGGVVLFDWDGGRSTTGTVLTPAGSHRIDFHSLHNYTFTTTLTYEYVPEPTSLSVLASMILLPLLLRRCRLAATLTDQTSYRLR
jgi:hypothetical protein